MRRIILSLFLSAALAASPFLSRGQAADRLAVRISDLQMVAPGRIRFDVAISGLEPALEPTIGGTATLGDRSIEGAPGPVVASRIPVFLDLRAGRVLIGGNAPVGEFTPVPPLEENMPIAVEVTVRQGDEAATARQTGVLLLPTIIVPGYLNDLGGKPDPAVLAALEQRGYHATGASIDLFWFNYPSRRLSLEESAQALATYVHDVVLPTTYATRINVVGQSLGGLLVRWNMAFEPGWDHLVNRFVMVGVPNEGAIMSYVDAWYPIAAPWARTLAARSLLPTFPFWRPAPGAPWGYPPGVRNLTLAELNSHPLPDGLRAYAFYGNWQPTDPTVPGTWAGVTGELPDAGFSYGPGDGIVLTASALGAPINGGGGVPGLADRLVKVDLGAARHLSLFRVAISKVVDVLTDRGAVARTHIPGESERRARVARDPLKNASGTPIPMLDFSMRDKGMVEHISLSPATH